MGKKRKKKKKTKRVCLRCDKEFLSDQPKSLNRICPNCQDSNANVYDPRSNSDIDYYLSTEDGIKTSKRQKLSDET